MTLQSRGYTVGFLDGNAGPEANNDTLGGSHGDWRFAGVVRENRGDSIRVEVKDKLAVGEVIEGLSPNRFEPVRIQIRALTDPMTGESVSQISAGRVGQMVEIPLDKVESALLPPLSVLRKKV